MTLFDTHAHLCDARFDGDRGEALARAAAAGVGRIVEIADSPADWDKALALSRSLSPERAPRDTESGLARPIVRCSLGLHPYHAADWSEDVSERLLREVRLPEVAAVGEIGLDYVKSPVPPEVQKTAFARMLEAAWAAGKPVVVHCRGAMADLRPMLESFYAGRPGRGPYRGVLHCFSGDAEHALAAVRLGFALGVDGPVTYPKNDSLREALRAAGLDHLVLETDSPYLPPQSRRGRRNEPALLPEIAARVAELFGVPPEEAARRTNQNGEKLFGLAPILPG